MPFFVLLSLLITQLSCAKQPTTLTLTSNQNGLQKWQIAIDLDKEDALYTDYFRVASDHEKLRIVSWNHEGEGNEHYDPQFKQNKKTISEPVTLNITTECDELPKEGNLHVSYYQRSDHKIHHELLAVAQPTDQNISPETSPEKKELSVKKQEKNDIVAWQYNLPIPLHLFLWIIIFLLTIIGIYTIKNKKRFATILIITALVFCSFHAAKYTIIYKTNRLPKL